MTQPIHNKPIEGRKCGECTACYTVLGILELKKPMWTPCEHECKGCNIYETRPSSCKDFQCMWIAGHFGIDALNRNWRDEGHWFCSELVERSSEMAGEPLLSDDYGIVLNWISPRDLLLSPLKTRAMFY